MIPRSLAVLLALAVGGCVYPGAVTGSAPVYADGYQPVMGGYATDWPAQPGALWGPEDVPNIEVFFEPLAVHGRWVRSRWGQAFQPAAPRGWQPYVNGQWLDNRFWLSADPWGWATDHYGRWGFDPAIGWVWVPGTNWGPSWVAWREADEVVGWAPIPPQIAWNVGIGFGGGWGFDNYNSWYGPSWVWVPRGNLYVTRFGGRILPWNVGVNYWGRSRWQHAPYWGWNQPWDRGWGWRAPGRGYDPRVDNRWGNNGRQWNGDPRRGWRQPGGDPRRGDWNSDPRRDQWNGDPRRNQPNGDPRRGQPGSVGDRVGRDLAGQPRPQNPDGRGWAGQDRRGQPAGDNAGVDPRRNGWAGQDRRNRQPANNAGVDPRQDGWQGNGGNRPRQDGRQPGGVGGMLGGAMAQPQMQPRQQVQPQAQAQPQARPEMAPRPQRDFTPPPRREPPPRTEPSRPARESQSDERQRDPY